MENILKCRKLCKSVPHLFPKLQRGVLAVCPELADEMLRVVVAAMLGDGPDAEVGVLQQGSGHADPCLDHIPGAGHLEKSLVKPLEVGVAQVGQPAHFLYGPIPAGVEVDLLPQAVESGEVELLGSGNLR